MIRITYQTYSKILNKYFEDVKQVNSMKDWDIFNLALFHGKAIILKKEIVSSSKP